MLMEPEAVRLALIVIVPRAQVSDRDLQLEISSTSTPTTRNSEVNRSINYGRLVLSIISKG